MKTEDLKAQRAAIRRERREGHPAEDAVRPRTRAECPTSGPCPWVSCRHHLALDVKSNGSITYTWPELDMDVAAMPATCALNVVEQAPDGLSFRELGAVLNVTKEGVEWVSERAMVTLSAALGGEFVGYPRGTQADDLTRRRDAAASRRERLLRAVESSAVGWTRTELARILSVSTTTVGLDVHALKREGRVHEVRSGHDAWVRAGDGRSQP